jgi:predicted amidophosphoribosyltransferase
MEKVNYRRTKKCPVCKKQYPAEDNYCRDDGTPLEQLESLAAEIRKELYP